MGFWGHGATLTRSIHRRDSWASQVLYLHCSGAHCMVCSADDGTDTRCEDEFMVQLKMRLQILLCTEQLARGPTGLPDLKSSSGSIGTALRSAARVARAPYLSSHYLFSPNPFLTRHSPLFLLAILPPMAYILCPALLALLASLAIQLTTAHGATGCTRSAAADSIAAVAVAATRFRQIHSYPSFLDLSQRTLEH